MILTSATLSKAVSEMRNHDVGMISGEIGQRQDTPEFQRGPAGGAKGYSGKAHSQLGKELRDLGYSVTLTQGVWTDTTSGARFPEKSYFVVDLHDTGKLKEDLQALGAKYFQDAVLFIPAGTENGEMIGTASEETWNKFGWDPNAATTPEKGWTAEGRDLGKKREFTTQFRGRPLSYGDAESNPYLKQSVDVAAGFREALKSL